jgi:shikimate dehydrogenase
MLHQYGIIGYPLSHSFSPAYFNNKFAKLAIDAHYDVFPLENISLFPALLQSNKNLRGLNVTIPYKQSVIPFLDDLDDTAQVVGAVNCISINNGRSKGYNTDITGFKESLLPLLQSQHRQALVLGTGGASLAVNYALEQLGISYLKISRESSKGDRTYEQLTPDIITHRKLIINTTPLGMYPLIEDAPPLPYNAVGPQHLFYDLIYNPVETKFLALGKQHGAIIKNGLQMLELQAEDGWKIWNTTSH